ERLCTENASKAIVPTKVQSLLQVELPSSSTKTAKRSSCELACAHFSGLSGLANALAKSVRVAATCEARTETCDPVVWWRRTSPCTRRNDEATWRASTRLRLRACHAIDRRASEQFERNRQVLDDVATK